MESGMLILCVVLTALLITPFVFFRDGKRKSRTKNLLNNLAEMAKSENCTVSHSEVWNDAAIGMNQEAHILFFVQGLEPNFNRILVHLEDIKLSRVSVVSRTVERKSDSQKIIEKIDLILEHKTKAHPDVILSFYDADTDGMSLSGELQLAEKWNGLISEGRVGRVEKVGRVNRMIG